jgi:ribose 5-phosphate isomerase B
MAPIAVGADHAGVHLKNSVKRWLIGCGHTVLDFGTDSTESVDYPDYAALVAAAVGEGRARTGVLVCGSGIGMAIAANKVPGVRAAVCTDLTAARLGREHNDANVLALGARTTSEEVALAIVDTWLATPFGGGRHERRIAKLHALEAAHAPTR